MLTAFFDVRPARTRPTDRRLADPVPKPSEAGTTSVLAKFEAPPAEVNVPRAADAPGRQLWQGLVDTETKDDDLGTWEALADEDDDGGGGPEDADDVSEPDYEADSSLDMDAGRGGGDDGGDAALSSSADEALDGSLRRVFGLRRGGKALASTNKAVYGGPLLCCEDDDDDEFY